RATILFLFVALPGVRGGRKHLEEIRSLSCLWDHAVGYALLAEPAAVCDGALVSTDRGFRTRIKRKTLGVLVLKDRLILTEDGLLEAAHLWDCGMAVDHRLQQVSAAAFL